MWIKASGTELADAETKDIFVLVDREAARAEALRKQGDGSCKTTVMDPDATLRPSIETSFHALFDWPVVAHTHSVATLTHAISAEGRTAARDKLAGLPFVMAPYAKPGLPLTDEIRAAMTPETTVVILQNHGLICCGATVEDVEALMDEVERRLNLSASNTDAAPQSTAPEGFTWAAESWMALDERVADLATSGSYYPDHVVFLGPSLPKADHAGHPPAILIQGQGIALRDDATPSQRAMVRCLSDVLSRVPQGWSVGAIGSEAEAELLNWDAEKYRQALADRA